MGFNESEISAFGAGREDGAGWAFGRVRGRLLSGIHHYKDCDVKTVLVGS